MKNKSETSIPSVLSLLFILTAPSAAEDDKLEELLSAKTRLDPDKRREELLEIVGAIRVCPECGQHAHLSSVYCTNTAAGGAPRSLLELD